MEKKQAILVPMIALRGMSIFPGMAISFPAGRQKSLDALQAAEENGKFSGNAEGSCYSRSFQK